MSIINLYHILLYILNIVSAPTLNTDIINYWGEKAINKRTDESTNNPKLEGSCFNHLFIKCHLCVCVFALVGRSNKIHSSVITMFVCVHVYCDNREQIVYFTKKWESKARSS